MRTVAALLVLLGAASAQKTAGDYHLSKNGKCPKGWSFMDKASVNECTAASRALKLQDKTASWTSSTTIPLGCAAYNKGRTVYFAMSGTKSTTYSYYQAICKKASATTCTCEGGQPAFGSACKKTGAAACAACHKGYKLNAKKTACTPQFQSKKGTYIVSYKGTCPKGYSFVDTNFNECKEALKVLKNGQSLTTRVYKTNSRGYPKGCSFYANYNRGYFSGEGRTNYDYQGYGYYKAVCRKNSQKDVNVCTCNHGEAPHGKACKKHGAKVCTKCYLYHKLNKAKTSCDATQTKVYLFSKTGLCPKSHNFMTSGKAECEYAAKALNLRDKTAYTTGSTYIPRGCSYYYGNSLYFAPKGTTDYKLSYYHSICKLKGAKECVCGNGEPAVGNACPKNKALACKACNMGYKLSNDKKNCNQIKGDYKVSTNGKCPKGFTFLEGSRYECQDAAKALGIRDRTAAHTSSTGIPRGCSFYNTNALYWAPLGTKTYRYTYYKAICKHAQAKHCVCKEGHAAHGKACKKNKALQCVSCYQGFKLNSKKTNCDAPTTKKYFWSKNGKCPKGFAHLTTSRSECQAAGKLLYIKDKTARSYRSGSQPKGCYQYTSGDYADLRMNSLGRTTLTSTYYRAICKSTGGKQCKCPNGSFSHGSACSKNGAPGCTSCNAGYELDKKKTKCTHVKSDYTVSTTSKCPKDFRFLEGSAKECETAAKELKLNDKTAYGTSSTYIPRGCSYYNSRSLYFAPRGSTGSRSTYYKAICKKASAKECVCKNGDPAHGKACPKHKALKCASCSSGFKINSKKTNCDKVTSKLYEYSSNGKCIGKAHIADKIATCNAAAKALSLKDQKARVYSNANQPKGCYMYVSGSYADLRFNAAGRTTGTSRYYRALCHHRTQKLCVCKNGHPAIGSACPKTGAKKCAVCDAFHALSKDKSACNKHKDKDYAISDTGRCPKDYEFLENGAKECEYAAAKIRSPDTTAYGTSSTYIPRGCSYYYGGSLYFAPRGTKTYGRSYYRAICKHKGAKDCTCPHGVAAHGNKCPKNRAQLCTSCNMLYKLSKDKKTCVKIVSWKYMLSSNGKCPSIKGKKKFIPLKTGKAACNAAAKALGLPDTTSRSYTNNYQPTGCYMYKSGSYHDLRYNTKGLTTGTSTYYRSICLNTVKEPKQCPGDADGNKKVDIEDLLALLGSYGKTGSGLKADFKADKKIDVEDLLIILGNYGKKCSVSQASSCAAKDLALHWEGRSAHTVHGAFGSQKVSDAHISNKPIALANPITGCTALKGGSMKGKIALIRRGGCRFDYKTFFAQKKGAIGVIIGNNGGDAMTQMDGNKKVCLNDQGKTDNKKCLTLSIPALFLQTDDANELFAAVKKQTIKASIHCSYCPREDMVLDYGKGKHATTHANFGAEIHTSPELYKRDMVLTTPKEGCKKLSGKSYKGKIALISRGSCRFDLKTYYAQTAGAKAVVIYNNGDSWNSNTIMGGNPKVNGVLLKIPSLFLSTADGKKVAAEINKAKSKSIKGSIHCN